MRKLLFVLICFLSFSSVFSQSYRVNFSPTNPITWGYSTTPSTSSTTLATITDENYNVYYAGNYATNNFSYLKKFNIKGEELFAYNFGEQIFFSGLAKTVGRIAKNSLNQFIIVGQKRTVGQFNQLRIVCLDSNLNRLWDVLAPGNVENSCFFPTDIKFDTDNSIFIMSQYTPALSPPFYSDIFKFNSAGIFQWQKVMSDRTSEIVFNSIYKIDGSAIYAVIANNGTNIQLKNYYKLYKIDKNTGNTINSTANGNYFSTGSDNGYSIKTFSNNYYLSFNGYSESLQPHNNVLRKFASNLDSVWTKLSTSITSSTSMDIDNNENIYITGSPSTISYDANGNIRWTNSTYKGGLSQINNSNYLLYALNVNDPVITKLDLNGNFLIASEKYNPFNTGAEYLYTFPNPLGTSVYKVNGIVSDASNIKHYYFNTLNAEGLLTNSIIDNFYNDTAKDFKMFSTELYISGTNVINANTSNAFINKFSTNGSLQWSKNIFSNTKGTASINNIFPNSSGVYGTGEQFDTLTNRNNAALIGLDNSGNVNLNFSFKGILNLESSGKIIKVNNSSVFVAGQYKDSLNRSKIFLAKNTGNTNNWLIRFNTSESSSDSVVSILVDQTDNCYISYNSFESGISVAIKNCKIYSNGSQGYTHETQNSSGIFLKKSASDASGYVYNLLSAKVSGNYDLVTQKLDTGGTSLWSDVYNNTFNTDDMAADMVLDMFSNIIVASNFVNSSSKTDAFTMKISNAGERVWNKIYNSTNKFVIKKLNTDDLNCYYLSGFTTDASNNIYLTTLEYDKDGIFRYTFNYNQRDTSLLSFANNYMDNIVTNVQSGTKKMFSISNINKINKGSDVKINIFNSSTITNAWNSSENIADKFSLRQNYPNPFNPNTVISFKLQVSSYISLNVYDANGRLLKILESGFKQAGNYNTNFSAEGLSSGVYYYSLYADGVLMDTKKAVVLK